MQTSGWGFYKKKRMLNQNMAVQCPSRLRDGVSKHKCIFMYISKLTLQRIECENVAWVPPSVLVRCLKYVYYRYIRYVGSDWIYINWGSPIRTR